MSRENVELLRRWLWAFENDTAAFRGLLHPEIEWFPFEENRTPVHGVADAVRNRNEWLATWDEHRFDLSGLDAVAAQLHLIVEPADELERAVGSRPREIARAIHPRARLRAKRIGHESFGRQVGTM